jgi:hypothetical protein
MPHSGQVVEPPVREPGEVRAEVQLEQVEQAEDQIGVAGRVGGVFGDRELGLVIEDPVEDVGRIAQAGSQDAACVVAVLVGGPGVKGDAVAEPEVARQRSGVLAAPGGDLLARELNRP